MKNLYSIIILTFLSQFYFSQSFNKSRLDEYFQNLEKNNKFMGSIAVSKNGTLIYSNSFGASNIDLKQNSNENTKYRIGSVSKTFTSVLVLKAIEQGKISLETKLSKYFPSIKNSEIITISNLLNHRSGVHDFTNNSDFFSYNTEKKTQLEMLNIIESGGSDFEPNSKSNYSNSNYVLLSFILEKIYEKPYTEILNDGIVKPLNLKNTFFGKQINEKKNESFSYSFANSWEKESETDPSIPIGAGSIVSTPIDLTSFLYKLFNGNLLSKNSLKLMTTIKDNFGFGLREIPFENKLIFGHTGKIDEFTSEIGYIPTDKIVFAITSNGLNYNLNDISSVILKAVFNEPFEIPTFTTIEMSSNELDKFVGDYSSEDIPLKISVKKVGDKLIANNGKSDLELDTVSKNSFRYDAKGILFEFPSANSMTFSQNGMIFKFTKK